MPAPGDQYSGGNVKNPFEERVNSNFTASEIATLQTKLNKQLGPEYISQRPGNGGGRVAYLEGNKAIALANEVFGFNGWSSSLGQVQIDYVDEHQNGKVSLGLSIVVRITLKDGTYHEDIGYGSIENGKGKAASFEKAKKEAATDGLKRSLRTFGNVLGNCLYDKEYLKKVQAMKVKPIKFQEDNLYRHVDFAPRLPQPEPQAIVKQEALTTPARPDQLLRTRTDQLNNESFGADFDDETDENLFDGVDVSEGHGDEFSFSEGLSASETTAPRTVESGKPKATPIHPTKGQEGLYHKYKTADNLRHQFSSNHAQCKTMDQNQQAPNNQPPRPNPPQAQQPPNQQRQVLQAQPTTTPATNPTASNQRLSVGFVTSRAAELLQASETPTLNNLPQFNPNAESPIPKEKRTPGIDHARSVPIKREAVGAPPAPQPAPQRPGAPSTGSFNRPNIVNPHLDSNRRIGMPSASSYAMSPSANRGAYKPPTFANGNGPNGIKRERAALQDVSNVGVNGQTAAVEGPDAKKQKVDTPLGAENNAGVAST
ncbi:hypothetical protein J3E72DRAFT_233710 [Bipolaris maydis]|nr:hypothetical protein J3E74DRAFT_271386 [Bipolaris maydis]KAJ6201728.1 hypothetical protein J3E72DRAFT_233710 [Bipolaris maydis]